MKTLHGRIRGRTIELDEDAGIAEGKEVEIQVTEMLSPVQSAGEGLLATEGALADDGEWDAIMDEIHQARKSERSNPIADLGET